MTRFRLRRPAVRVLLTLACLGTAAAASGQTPAIAPSPTQTVDVGDLWHLLRHAAPKDPAQQRERFLVAAPSIGSKPSTGLSVGVSSSMAFFSGDPSQTHISSLAAGVKFTQEGQTLFGGRLSLFTPHDTWFVSADNRIAWTSQNTYAFGTSAPADTAVKAKYNASKLYETVYRAVRPGLFVGGGVNATDQWSIHQGSGAPTDWSSSALVVYSAAHGFSPDHQRSGGVNAGLRFDTRDNAINPEGGWLASGTYRGFAKGFLGGDSDWQEVSLDVRTYRKLTPSGRQKLAIWMLGDFVASGAAPFFDLPANGADGRSSRGYTEGRYRGDHLLYAETEYRGTLTANGLIGFAAFLNATTVSDPTTPGNHLFDTIAPAGGLGLRVLLNKRSKTNLCTDYGWGRGGSHGFYLSIQEAF